MSLETLPDLLTQRDELNIKIDKLRKECKHEEDSNVGYWAERPGSPVLRRICVVCQMPTSIPVSEAQKNEYHRKEKQEAIKYMISLGKTEEEIEMLMSM